MKKLLLMFSVSICSYSFAQITIDTLGIQDFEVVPKTPTWNFTGAVVHNTILTSGAGAAPANSPTSYNARSWETTANGTGIVLTFSNVIIPTGYDSIRVKFKLAAMNLTGATGGPDNLDYVLTEVSTDGGTNYYNRLRVRGATTDNSFWAFSATGVSKLYYQPQTEVVFAPTASGLQTTQGYSSPQIVFPGSVTQISVRITARSSSTTDTWLVDNVVITGEKPGGSTGLTTMPNDGVVRIYPNPATDKINIICKDNSLKTARIYNSLGALVLTKEISSENESIDISGLSTGIYILNMNGYTKKLIKQ